MTPPAWNKGKLSWWDFDSSSHRLPLSQPAYAAICVFSHIPLGHCRNVEPSPAQHLICSIHVPPATTLGYFFLSLRRKKPQPNTHTAAALKGKGKPEQPGSLWPSPCFCTRAVMLLPVSVTWLVSTCLLPPPLLIVNAAHTRLKCSGSLRHTGCSRASCWFSVSLQLPGGERALAGHDPLVSLSRCSP